MKMERIRESSRAPSRTRRVGVASRLTRCARAHGRAARVSRIRQHRFEEPNAAPKSVRRMPSEGAALCDDRDVLADPTVSGQSDSQSEDLRANTVFESPPKELSTPSLPAAKPTQGLVEASCVLSFFLSS